MKKYTVYGIMTASTVVGEYEAESKEEAEEMANNDPDADWTPCLCHQCSSQVELGDAHSVQVEEIE